MGLPPACRISPALDSEPAVKISCRLFASAPFRLSCLAICTKDMARLGTLAHCMSTRRLAHTSINQSIGQLSSTFLRLPRSEKQQSLCLPSAALSVSQVLEHQQWL